MKTIISTILLSSLLSVNISFAAEDCSSKKYQKEIDKTLDPQAWVDKENSVQSLYVLAEAKNGSDLCAASIRGQARFDQALKQMIPLATAVKKDPNQNTYVTEYLDNILASLPESDSKSEALTTEKPLKNFIVALVEEFVGVARDITAGTNGCLNVTLANAYFKNLFDADYVPLEKICISKKTNSVNWKWSRNFDVDPVRVAEELGLSFDASYPALLKIEKEGSLDFKEKKDKLVLNIDGFSLFLKPENHGKFKFVNATVKGLTLNDNDSSLKVNFMTMGLIPFSVNFGSDEDGNPFAKVFGMDVFKIQERAAGNK